MSTPTFNQPQSGGGYFDSKNHVGSLILITKVHEVYHNSMNVYQGKPAPRDEAKVDVVDLTNGQHGYQLRERVIMTHPGLVNRLSTGAQNILGRVTKEQGREGEYYALQPYEENDVQIASRWVTWWQSQQMQQPQQAPQAAQQQQGGPQYGTGPSVEALQQQGQGQQQAGPPQDNPWGGPAGGGQQQGGFGGQGSWAGGNQGGGEPPF